MQTFRDYMEAALYDPERGYYSRRIPTEDFYTAPELHPAFAGVLARKIAEKFAALSARGTPGPYSIVEMGSSSGLLAADVLKSLKRENPEWARALRYIVVERSRPRLLESVVTLSALHEGVIGYSRLEDVLPCAGVFLSNELVDALPVHLLEKRDGRMYEVYVEESGRTVLSDLSTRELAPMAEGVAPHLAEGERHAVNLEALRWLRVVEAKLKEGFLLTIDYGKRFGGAPNPPRTYHRHTIDSRLTEGKGLKDITASVDFDLLIGEGRKLGFKLHSYEPLGRFLVEGGIGDWINDDEGGGPHGREEVASYRSRAKIKTLIHPEAMGEAFKVLILEKAASA
ncbi:MAG: SAM-dependent methyltransferase [Elusimicrobia bacterium]|nr:SAM-dependent methyltransferase [Elusimicrobiota bacterium]